MRTTYLALIAGLSLLLTGSSADSQTIADPRTKLFLECAGGGIVGTNLCYEVKERIAKASNLTLSTTENEAFAKVRLHCADASRTTGDAVAVAVMMTLLPSDRYLHDQVLWVGANRLEFAATAIVAGIDQYLEQLFREAARSRQTGPPR